MCESPLAHRLRGLCLPPLLFCLLDGALTLAGQSPEYWGGAHAQVNETSPTFHHLLQIHPAAFAIGLLAWCAVFIGLILLLPDTLALILCIAVTMGHTVGAATWLLWRFEFGYQACNGLFLLSAVILGLGIRWGWGATVAANPPTIHWPQSVRWTAIAVLLTVAAYLFLWPTMP